MKFKFYFLWLSLFCVIVFILQSFFSGFTDLFVLNSKAVYEYQYWRLVSAIFLHGSIIHLMYNLFALLFFGVVLEKLIGSRRFLIIFFASGIVANIIAVNFYPSSLGASGAIYGILGCLTILKPMMMIWAFGLMMPMFIAAVFWIIGDLLGVFGVVGGNVGHIAHLSGVAVGILSGLVMRFFKKKEVNKTLKLIIPDKHMRIWEDNHMK